MDVINAWMEAKARGDKLAIASLIADDIVMESPKGTINGKEKLIETVKYVVTHFFSSMVLNMFFLSGPKLVETTTSLM